MQVKNSRYTLPFVLPTVRELLSVFSKGVTHHWHLLVQKKRKLGKGVLILVVHSSHYSLAFPLSRLLCVLQIECQESRPLSLRIRSSDPTSDQSSDPAPAHISPTRSELGDWKDQLTLLSACQVKSHGLLACMVHQDTLWHILVHARSLLSWCALMQNALLSIILKGN